MELSAYGRPVATPFHLIGADENALTSALAWCLARCPAFMEAFAGKVEGLLPSPAATVALQAHQGEYGITDIKVHDPGKLAWVVEAKVGFSMPSHDQLAKYADHLTAQHAGKEERLLVVLAQSDKLDQALQAAVPSHVNGVRVRAVSWRAVIGLARTCASAVGNVQKGYLRDLVDFLEEVLALTNAESNQVFVVAISDSTFGGGPTTFREVVEKYAKYFHPVGNHWPTSPPNYMGFRYDGKLQSIHHVDSYTVIDHFSPHFPDIREGEIDRHFLYTLGPPIRPAGVVRTGKGIVMAARAWVAIDLLLTCDTITEARDQTLDRRRQAGEAERLTAAI